MATFLVTGAAGFIGSNLVRALLARGENVRGLDNFATGKPENLVGLEACDFVEGDVNHAALLAGLLTGVDCVLHQAAIPSIPRSLSYALATHGAGATGTLTLLEACRGSRTVRRVVCASSSSVYGDDGPLPRKEDQQPQPRSPYAVAKLAAEHYTRVYTQLHGVPALTLRYFNVFGPGQDPASPYAAVVPRFIAALREGRSPTVFGDGEQTRDLTYVDNITQANLLACTAEGAVGGVFNIAGGVPTSINALCNRLQVILGTALPVEHAPARPGDVRDSWADIGAAHSVLGYAPTVGLDEGLQRTAAALVQRGQGSNAGSGPFGGAQQSLKT